MFIPQVDIPALFNNSILMSSLPLDKPPRVSFDMSGVLGLTGGDDAVSAMTTVHVYGNRRWLGWYNNPGSFQIAKRLRSIAKSGSFHSIPSDNLSQKSLSEGVHTDPMALFGQDSFKGLRYRAAHSGTIMEETSYLAALFLKECAAWSSQGKVVPGRRTQPIQITIADLRHTPACEMHPAGSSASTILFASVPIAASVGACMLCVLFEDWYASLLILMGIVASGVSSYVLGSADLLFAHPEAAKGSPAGDGILGSDKDIVLLKGSEGAVNSITRGKFSLRFSSAAHHTLVQWTSFLFLIQCVAQLLLIPQASLFGQVMFLATFGVSALYNAWLSSLDKEKCNQKLLFERVLASPTLTKYTLGTRTSAVVFMLLVLQLQDPTRFLNEMLPNDTKVWRQWKATVLEQLRHCSDKSSFPSEIKFGGDLDGFTQQEQDLLQILYDDAQAACTGYRDYLRVDSL